MPLQKGANSRHTGYIGAKGSEMRTLCFHGSDGAAGVASTGVDFSDVLPSALGLAVVGLSVFMDKSLSAGERATVFGERSGRVGVSSLAGKGVMLVTQTWWLGLLGGVGSQWLSSKGRVKREQYEALASVLDIVRERTDEHPALRLSHAGPP